MSNDRIGNGDRLSKIGMELYLKPDKADVYFVFGNERVPAHKIILSSASAVFDAMFYGSLKEQGDIRIVDASSDAFKEFLQFFYINEVELTVDNISQVMHLVKKYDVIDCLSLCADFLLTEVTFETATIILDLALIYEQTELSDLCEVHIGVDSNDVLISADFVKCTRRVLHHIVNMEFLTCTEIELFEACMSWVKVASNQEELTRDIVQNHLGEIFYQIRFRSIPQREFAEFMQSYGHLFSPAEYQEILQMTSTPKYKPKMFTDLRRCLGDMEQAWDKSNEISCNRRDIEQAFNSIRRDEFTTFTTNTVLLFGYFECGALYNCDGAQIDYIRDVQATVLADSCKIDSFIFNYNKFSYKVKLPTPVIIKPTIKYQLQLTFPSINYCGKATFKSIVEATDGIVIKFHNDRYEDGYIVGAIDVLWFNLLK